MAVSYYDLGYTSNGYRMAYCTVAGGTLTTGVQTEYLPFEGVVDFFPAPPNGFVTEERTSDYVKEYAYAVTAATANTFTITAKKMQVSATNTWGAAATADISDNSFGFLVFGV
jgi:hypothetical protein